jgi:hypothetical protein
MKKLIIVCFVFLFLSKNSFSINDYKEGDTLYVWAPNGVTLRTEKSETSDKILAIKYGEKVVVLEHKNVHDEEYVIEIDIENSDGINDDFLIEGAWVKVKYRNTIGYIFDGYVSKLIPMKSGENFIEYAERSFNKVKVFENFKEDYRVHYHVVYDNGIMIDQEANIKCSNYGIGIYFLPMTLEEAYLIFVAKYFCKVQESDCMYKGCNSGIFGFEFGIGGIDILQENNYVVVKEWNSN